MGTALYVQHPQAVAHTRWKLAFGDLVCAHCFSVSSSNESSSVRAVIDWPVARFDPRSHSSVFRIYLFLRALPVRTYLARVVY